MMVYYLHKHFCVLAISLWESLNLHIQENMHSLIIYDTLVGSVTTANEDNLLKEHPRLNELKAK